MKAKYAEEINTTNRNIKVVFFNADGIRLAREFEPNYPGEKAAKNFIRKINKSKQCTFVSCLFPE